MTSEIFLATLDFLDLFSLLYAKLYCFGLIWSIREKSGLDFVLLSFDFDDAIEGVNCRIRAPSLLKLPSLKVLIFQHSGSYGFI